MLDLIIPSQVRKVAQHCFHVLAHLARRLQVLVLPSKKIDPLRGFHILHQGKQVLDRFPYLMGMRDPDFTIDEGGRASIGDNPDSEQQDEYGPKAHRNFLL